MLACVATSVATTIGFHCIGLDNAGKEKTRKALCHAGYRGIRQLVVNLVTYASAVTTSRLPSPYLVTTRQLFVNCIVQCYQPHLVTGNSYQTMTVQRF